MSERERAKEREREREIGMHYLVLSLLIGALSLSSSLSVWIFALVLLRRVRRTTMMARVTLEDEYPESWYVFMQNKMIFGM